MLVPAYDVGEVAISVSFTGKKSRDKQVSFGYSRSEIIYNITIPEVP